MIFYYVKNWEKFQHYKDRNPPWIKLHFEILSSMDWVALDDASRVLAVACMLIASRNNGRVPNDPHYMRRVAYLNSVPKFKPLLDCGFLEISQADASALLADASTMHTNARPETETYREETEKERIHTFSKNKRSAINYTSDFEIFWKAYPNHAGSKSEAFKSYQKSIDLTVTTEIILSGVKKFSAHHTALGTEEKFIAHATTWLNQRRWEADYEEKPKQNLWNSGLD